MSVHVPSWPKLLKLKDFLTVCFLASTLFPLLSRLHSLSLTLFLSFIASLAPISCFFCLLSCHFVSLSSTQISLIEIGQNIDNGVYHNSNDNTSMFTAYELTKLVQSLFDDTTNRAKLIQKIQAKLAK